MASDEPRVELVETSTPGQKFVASDTARHPTTRCSKRWMPRRAAPYTDRRETRDEEIARLVSIALIARQRGVASVVLRTGNRQNEAITLYTKIG